MKLGIFLIVWGVLITALLIAGLWAESVLWVVQGDIHKPGELVASIILYAALGPLPLIIGWRRLKRLRRNEPNTLIQ